MTVDFSKDVMVGMLRKGATGTQILDILNAIVPETQVETAPADENTPDSIEF